MNIKKINNTVIAFLLSNTFLSNIEAIEVLEIKMLDEYAITREFPGKLIPSNQSRLAFEIPGKINSINVDIGDEVILGDELASLDDREALAQLNQSKAKFDLAEQVLARYIDLRADGHISTQDLDKAESDQIVAKSQYDFYRVKFEQTKLLAPFNGIIQNRFLDTGSVINAGVQVLEILGSSNVEARISIPMNYMDKVKIGEEYEFDIRGISAKAKLERLAPMSTGGSNNRLAIFRFNTFFNPGSIVKLKLSMTEKAKGTWVPIKSLSQSEQGIWAIYTINEQQVVVRDLVDVIYFEDEYAFVSGTLNNGDLVILGGAQKTIEGKIIK
ncbi:efflux RND transporter periplasmic adaptor subunit [Gammaproteobacteria bacterium]|jgi:RND family efflux transporter MFP subunit|nr:efflux RND transporter periplasmic adaptor subunit [Gammaproteobacteria bacterium]MDA8674700.1 efflux RND transporter periplasmic adaptor subunit [Gammaproteobacteria bacterium]MDA8683577.1 efflux RND transporter periplasmic adaptor subunit [Gammaproteobacteria bacterium]MDA8862200.1 efflux RND transporter periplasmic adaptor subunit [Gammaproteobacteria bacterium]MDA8915836.1 efflux RND transporter periplasmic adaptor subunit [Gammaproteobacteria bacterium]